MSDHDFSRLLQCYPEIIGLMRSHFTSHEFILKLAQRHQTEYIDALAAYRGVTRDGANTPFMVVHNVLSKHLHDFTDLVEHAGEESSKDIFGNPNTCAGWTKR